MYGTVTEVSPGTMTLRVDRVLKGQVGSTLRVFVGPGRGGSVTSVDYPDIGRPAQVGSDHVLYLTRGGDGQLETNACVGSHPGPPDASEVAFFGLASPAPRAPTASTAPAASTPGSGPMLPAPSAIPPAMWAVLILAAVILLASIPIVRRGRMR